MATMIRAPRPGELELLRDLERRAGVLFAEVGLAHVAAHEPDSVEALAQYLQAERVWVIGDDGQPVGYALVDIVDGTAHLEQLSVLPERGRRGYGASLLHHVCSWAGEHNYDKVTLTTHGLDAEQRVCMSAFVRS